MAYISPDYSNFEMLAVYSDGVVSVGNLLQIKSIKVASHGDNQSYLVTLEESIASGVLRTFEINFTEFNASQEAATQILNKSGYVLSSFKYANHIRDYLATEIQDKLRLGQLDYYHSSLGFTRMSDGTKRFLLGDTTYRGKVSTFIDPNFKFTEGLMGDYIAFLSTDIMPYFETRLAFVLGLSSVVSSDLMEYGDIGTMVLNLSGQSSTGKTTIAQFLASLWGSPRVSNKGIVRTFASTTNALVQTFTGINGVPIVIDDSSSLGVKDLSSFIYNIAAGEDKLRLTSEIQLRESKGSWSGLVAITSETSIMEHSTKTGGSIPRLLEFDNVVWTQSAKHSKSIKRNIARSFGHIGPDFVNRYRLMSIQDKRALFDACEDELEELISVRDQYTSRIVAKLSIIYMTAKFIEKYYQFPEFSSNEIRDYLVEFENTKVPVRSIEVQALDIIKTFIIRNQHRMAYKSNQAQMMELTSNGDFIGYKQYINKDIIEVTVISKVLSDELMRNNITQWSNILRHLEKQPFVKTYGIHHKASETNNYLRVKTITFRFQRDNDEMVRWYFTEEGLNHNQKKDMRKASPTYDDALTIEQIFN